MLKSILSIFSAAGFRKNPSQPFLGSSRNRCLTSSLKGAAKETISRENYYKLTSGSSTQLKLLSIGGEFNRQTNEFGFSTVYHVFQARFQGEKTRFRR